MVQTIEKEVKNSKHYITFEIFTQLSSELQQQIPGDPVGGIHYRFFQVFPHALLFHFDAFFNQIPWSFEFFRPN